MKLTAVLFGVLVPDFALTCVVAVIDRRPRLLLLGVFFPLLRLVDAAIGLYAVPAAGWSSNGRWKSPARRGLPAGRPAGSDAARCQPRSPGRNRRAPPRRAFPAGPPLPRSQEKALMHLHDDTAVLGGQSRQMSPLRLLLVDDHLMVTEALASRLSSAPDLWVAGRCTTAEPNLLDIVRGVRPDIITVEAEPLGAGRSGNSWSDWWRPGRRRGSWC